MHFLATSMLRVSIIPRYGSRGDAIRLISARPATAKERRGYEEGI